jgi:hypothetical protein
MLKGEDSTVHRLVEIPYILQADNEQTNKTEDINSSGHIAFKYLGIAAGGICPPQAAYLRHYPNKRDKSEEANEISQVDQNSSCCTLLPDH